MTSTKVPKTFLIPKPPPGKQVFTGDCIGSQHHHLATIGGLSHQICIRLINRWICTLKGGTPDRKKFPTGNRSLLSVKSFSFLLETFPFYPSNFFRLLRTGNQEYSFHAIAHTLLAVSNKAGSFFRSTRHDQNKTPKLTNSPTRIISINTNKRHKDNLFDTFEVTKYQNGTS